MQIIQQKISEVEAQLKNLRDQILYLEGVVKGLNIALENLKEKQNNETIL